MVMVMHSKRILKLSNTLTLLGLTANARVAGAWGGEPRQAEDLAAVLDGGLAAHRHALAHLQPHPRPDHPRRHLPAAAPRGRGHGALNSGHSDRVILSRYRYIFMKFVYFRHISSIYTT